MTDHDPIPPAEVALSGVDGPTEDHLMRMDLTIEVAAAPEVVWEAIATGPGLGMWFLETELEGRVGGHVAFHMGPEMASEGEVTAWEPGRRLEYSEPDWVQLAGRENSGQQPLISEFVIEATSGGTSVLRVVSSAYGTGAEWEREWFADMAANWAPSFDRLARYVARHAGVPGVRLAADVTIPGDAHRRWPQIIEAMGSPTLGAAIRLGDATGIVERTIDEPNVKELLLRFDEPVAGFAAVAAHDIGDDTAVAVFWGALFGDGATSQARALEDGWRASLAPLAGS